MIQWYRVTTSETHDFLVLVVQGLVASSSAAALAPPGANWREWRASIPDWRAARLLACECGANLGRVTLKTKGLCEVCGASKWLQCARAILPKSKAIATGLTARKAGSCVHGESICISRCGVERQADGTWQPVGRDRRETWFKRIWRKL